MTCATESERRRLVSVLEKKYEPETDVLAQLAPNLEKGDVSKGDVDETAAIQSDSQSESDAHDVKGAIW